MIGASDTEKSTITTQIIKNAQNFGAALAGIVNVSSLKESPSHKNCRSSIREYSDYKSILVLALSHEISNPELDWWDDEKGGSPGNRQLITIAKSVIKWLRDKFNINAQLLPYHVKDGGIFLKDAAALSGLGSIGRNNLLITPKFGPRVRLRALLLDADLEPTRLTNYTPCIECDIRCHSACPQKAFKNTSYSRKLCNKMMEINKTDIVMDDKRGMYVVKYCRACELICPIGK